MLLTSNSFLMIVLILYISDTISLLFCKTLWHFHFNGPVKHKLVVKHRNTFHLDDKKSFKIPIDK